MQGLIDAAVVVVTMIIPTLNPQSFKKIFHAKTSNNGSTIMKKSCEKTVTFSQTITFSTPKISNFLSSSC
jgi:hypothetical protein